MKQLRQLFRENAAIEVYTDPDSACRRLESHAEILGCLTDVVFRMHSAMGGVQIAETAIRLGIPVLVYSPTMEHTSVSSSMSWRNSDILAK